MVGGMGGTGAKYRKNGLSGVIAFCSRAHRIALSVMSSMKW
jgi:hypothetical protein